MSYKTQLIDDVLYITFYYSKCSSSHVERGDIPHWCLTDVNVWSETHSVCNRNWLYTYPDTVTHGIHNLQHNIRYDSGFAPSQWETALLNDDVSHWLGADLESALSTKVIYDSIGRHLTWIRSYIIIPQLLQTWQYPCRVNILTIILFLGSSVNVGLLMAIAGRIGVSRFSKTISSIHLLPFQDKSIDFF